MSRIALLGASSKIARDLILSYAARGQAGRLLLYVRDVARAEQWLAAQGLAGQCTLREYGQYGSEAHDAVLNFVGIGDPVKTAQMGGDIFTITRQYDEMVLSALIDAPQRRYIFLSSGAAYGSRFEQPADENTPAIVPLNAMGPQDFYGLAKLATEGRHRALPQFAITDLRVFNYFSRSQELEARFFITDILRAIRDGSVLRTSSGYMVRDYLHPQDFYQMVECVLAGPAQNQVLDCYSKEPVDKPALLQAMQERFGLQYEVVQEAGVTATGAKPHYYSVNRRAAPLGYQPSLTSIEGIMLESAALLGRA